MSKSIFGPVDEAVYYTLLILTQNGNGDNLQAYGWTTTEIFQFWEANVATNRVLIEHSPVTLTQDLVNSAVSLGSKRALYRIVFAGDGDSRYVTNQLTRQLPVQSRDFLISIGVFDREIAAALAECKVVTIPYAPSPALASSVQPPKQPDNATLAVNLPPFAISGCPGFVVSNATALAEGCQGPLF